MYKTTKYIMILLRIFWSRRYQYSIQSVDLISPEAVKLVKQSFAPKRDNACDFFHQAPHLFHVISKNQESSPRSKCHCDFGSSQEATTNVTSLRTSKGTMGIKGLAKLLSDEAPDVSTDAGISKAHYSWIANLTHLFIIPTSVHS